MLPHKELAKLLAEMALLLDLKGENPFRVRAYEAAARVVEKLEDDPRSLARSGGLTAVRGIGKGIAALIREWAETGGIAELSALREEVPRGLLEMLRVPGLGPGKVRRLREALGIESLDALEEACARNRLAGLKGFGPATQEKICLGIRKVRAYEGSFLLPEAEAAAREALACLDAAPSVTAVTLAGTLRRFLETAREIVVVAASEDPPAAFSALRGCGGLSGLSECGEGLCRAVAAPGIPVRFHVVSPPEYPFALLHETGSEEHVAALRAIASARGMELTPRGLLRGGAPLPCATEEDRKSTRLNSSHAD